MWRDRDRQMSLRAIETKDAVITLKRDRYTTY